MTGATPQSIGLRLAAQMAARALENAVRPDVSRISEQTGLTCEEVRAVVDREAARRAAARADSRLTPQLRAQVLLRAATQLEREAKTLRRLAMEDPAAAGLVCECGEVMADKAGLARHRTVKHKKAALR